LLGYIVEKFQHCEGDELPWEFSNGECPE